MKKISSTFIVITLFYALPLSGCLTLLGHWKILVLLVACVLMWVTQPAFSFKETDRHKNTDKFTFWLILCLALPAVAMPVIEWAYWLNPVFRNELSFANCAGLALLIGGLALRIEAIRTLNRFFTATVQMRDDHRLVTNGVYTFLRHPSYSGAYLYFLGSALWLGTWGGLAIAAVLMGVAYYCRIEVEERTLEGGFGETYRQYKEKTWRMIPGIW